MNDRDNPMPEPAAPEKLRAALSRLDARRVVVPPPVDDAILRAAREHLAEVAQTQGQPAVPAFAVPPSGGLPAPRARGISSWLEEFGAGLRAWFSGGRRLALGAVTVAIVAVGALAWLGGHPRSTAGPEDLNGDGVVDMLDAFALARELARDPASQPRLDLNGDGVVDERDVQALAAHAVRLTPGGHS
jgi:hypothetical protein